jgi:hypothetical protein
MRHFCLLLIVWLAAPGWAGADPVERRYLYQSTPDGAQTESGSGNGLLVFDIDDGHRFVRRIQAPIFKEGLRGLCGSARTHCVYYTTTNRRLGCFDLQTDKVLWERTYQFGCDRAAITPEGTKLYVPTGWWLRGPDSGFLVVNPHNGDLLKHLPVNHMAHNSLASLDGQHVYLGTETNLTIFRTRDDSVVRHIPGVGEAGVFPFTIDSRQRTAYVCLGKHVGFDVVDLAQGKLRHRVLAGAAPIAHRTHGAGLTPDERELWISDQMGKKLFVFDATQDPPREKAVIELSAGGHGWVAFSLDGRYAWSHTPDVIDARTKHIVATFKDERGQPFGGSKFIEVHFREGKVVRVGDQFGLGRAHTR